MVAEWNARKKAGDDEAAQLEITFRSWCRLAAEWRRSGVDPVEVDRRMVRLKVQLAVYRALNPDGWWRA